MKKAVNTLLIIFIILFFYLTKDINILPLTISFNMYLLFNSMFSMTRIKNKCEDNNNNIISRDTFRYVVLVLVLIDVFLIIISYFIGTLLNIPNLGIINIFMCISLVANVILNITKEYLDVLGYKRISNNLMNVYNIIVLLMYIILSILLFRVLILDTYINIIILYSVNILVFMIIFIFLYINIFKKKKKCRETKDKNMIKNIRNILVNNKAATMYNVMNNAYLYISMIILYYILINKYNYSYDNVNTLITNTYFYGLIVIYGVYTCMIKKINISYGDIYNKFNDNINKIVDVSLSTSILLIVISYPLSYILFGGENNVLFVLVPLLFVYTIYDYIIRLNIRYNKDKRILVTLIIGLIISILFTPPLINAIYRMGYTLTIGSILSIILGMVVSMIMGLFLVKYKFKLNLLDNFNNILNIIYDNIIYCLILVLLTLVVKVETDNIISSVLVVIFYLFVSILFQLVKKIMSSLKIKKS